MIFVIIITSVETVGLLGVEVGLGLGLGWGMPYRGSVGPLYGCYNLKNDDLV